MAGMRIAVGAALMLGLLVVGSLVCALADSLAMLQDPTASAALVPVLDHPSCNSWYNGGNVPGKKRMYMGYTAGLPEYRRRCDEIAAAGYQGFKVG